jgi:hypothetical protein
VSFYGFSPAEKLGDHEEEVIPVTRAAATGVVIKPVVRPPSPPIGTPSTLIVPKSPASFGGLLSSASKTEVIRRLDFNLTTSDDTLDPLPVRPVKLQFQQQNQQLHESDEREDNNFVSLNAIENPHHNTTSSTTVAPAVTATKPGDDDDELVSLDDVDIM